MKPEHLRHVVAEAIYDRLWSTDINGDMYPEQFAECLDHADHVISKVAALAKMGCPQCGWSPLSTPSTESDNG